MNHTEVAVHRAGGIEHVGTGAGRTEGPGKFLANVRRLAGPGHGDPAGPAAAQSMKQLDDLEECIIQASGNEFESRSLRAKNLPGVVKAGAGARTGFGQPYLKGHSRLHAGEVGPIPPGRSRL